MFRVGGFCYPPSSILHARLGSGNAPGCRGYPLRFVATCRALSRISGLKKEIFFSAGRFVVPRGSGRIGPIPWRAGVRPILWLVCVALCRLVSDNFVWEHGYLAHRSLGGSEPCPLKHQMRSTMRIPCQRAHQSWCLGIRASMELGCWRLELRGNPRHFDALLFQICANGRRCCSLLRLVAPGCSYQKKNWNREGPVGSGFRVPGSELKRLRIG